MQSPAELNILSCSTCILILWLKTHCHYLIFDKVCPDVVACFFRVDLHCLQIDFIQLNTNVKCSAGKLLVKLCF